MGFANTDTDIIPAGREDNCLHCGASWGGHSGWQCQPYTDASGKRHESIRVDGHLVGKKSLLSPDMCYLTPDMVKATAVSDTSKEAPPVSAPVPEVPQEKTPAPFDWDAYNGIKRRTW